MVRKIYTSRVLEDSYGVPFCRRPYENITLSHHLGGYRTRSCVSRNHHLPSELGPEEWERPSTRLHFFCSCVFVNSRAYTSSRLPPPTHWTSSPSQMCSVFLYLPFLRGPFLSFVLSNPTLLSRPKVSSRVRRTPTPFYCRLLPLVSSLTQPTFVSIVFSFPLVVCVVHYSFWRFRWCTSSLSKYLLLTRLGGGGGGGSVWVVRFVVASPFAINV